MSDSELRITGGCQCGAVRYALLAEPSFPHLCHCRMCQKAFGSYFAPLTEVPFAAFELTRGAPAIFRSSDIAERGFCRDCGTPLTFRHVETGGISVSMGSLDEPEKVTPTVQCGIEGRMPWFDDLAQLRATPPTEEDMPETAEKIAASNHQHPDHDTGDWPPRGGRGG